MQNAAVLQPGKGDYDINYTPDPVFAHLALEWRFSTQRHLPNDQKNDNRVILRQPPSPPPKQRLLINEIFLHSNISLLFCIKIKQRNGILFSGKIRMRRCARRTAIWMWNRRGLSHPTGSLCATLLAQVCYLLSGCVLIGAWTLWWFTTTDPAQTTISVTLFKS